MNRFLYTLVFYLALPAILLRLLWRSRQNPAYRRRWRERLGFYRRRDVEKPGRRILFHAVSVGEVHAASPFIRAWQREHPNDALVLTCTTPTGSSRIEALFGSSLQHVYLPYDLPGAVQRFLNFFKPDVLVLMETELWPNLLHHSQRRGIRIVLANARLSQKSFQRYRRIAALSKLMLRQIDILMAQTDADAQRFLALGLAPDKVRVTGSMKFDIDIPDGIQSAGASLRERLGRHRPVMIAGSTRDGEEARVLRAFRQIVQSLPEAVLILVPRHPERFDAVFELCRAAGFTVQRSSGHAAGSQAASLAETRILLGDALGELLRYYAAADVAFVGGSLVAAGGQNILEPAALGLPVITGPSLFNFQGVSDVLVAAGGMRVVKDENELAQQVTALLQHPQERLAMGAEARAVVQDNRGASLELMGLIDEVLADARQ
ncbi:MAG: lipid IV(A) 3-deoxy-D-manno-octulosonic acid transferase [Pseudomonadales bacterium]|nr:lipid IV(A) 3-deoxy-D-manno-octulosonic acid transferase [Pseudomonadales bacterium]